MEHYNKELYKIIQNLIKTLVLLHKKKNAVTGAILLSPQLKAPFSISKINDELVMVQKQLKNICILYDIQINQLCYLQSLNKQQLELLNTEYIKAGNKFYYQMYRKS